MSDSELAPMEGSRAVEDESGSLSIQPSAPPSPATVRPNFSSETDIESKAVSVASNDCSAALSSPAEASPAKPAATSTQETSPATSHMASASDSLTRAVTNLASESWVSSVPSNTFGAADLENDLPAMLTFKGISVTLENNSVWKQFYSCGTEMILTKPGRRMFPYCRYRLAGLDPDQQYHLVLSIVPSGQYRYRWSTSKWEIHGPPEHQGQGLIRAFPHHYSPCRGSEWMSGMVSFYKLKLTNNSQDQDGHIILHSMHRYIPRLHVIPVPDGADHPVVMGLESRTFTFPQTEFMAVTTYQNFRITQLKINHNPFAKGFREDGHNPRLQRVGTEAQLVVKTEPQASDVTAAAEPKEEEEEEAVDLSTKSPNVSASPCNAPETRLVLKPIMSNTGRDEPYVPCIRGRHALGELVLVEKRDEPKEEPIDTSITPEPQQGLKVWTLPKVRHSTPAFSTSTPGSSPGYRKRRKRINRRWANSRGREWKAAAASPTVAYSPSSTVAMQPELDDVEGLLFVSFTSKEALEGHVRDKSASLPASPASPVSLTTPKETKQTSEKLERTPETDEEKIARLEAVLLNDLQVLKHRQVIHPVLQEVGLKLSSLDPTKSIDLQYLGVRLPLPPPDLPEQNNTAAPSPGDEGLTFISRTGKTSDVTKIKGWKNKFIRSKETSLSNSEGLQKNLSAFCSNMLDEYLESEAQQISERAAAFSTNPEGSVAYQLPVKSSSYVKTLDSILKQRNATSRNPSRANRPCPLSHKPLLYSALTSPPPSHANSETPKEAETQSKPQTVSSNTEPAAPGSSCTADVPQRLPVYNLGALQRPATSFGLSHSTIQKSPGLTKVQLKLMQMEMRVMKEGVSRTELTADRLSMALSVILTKQMTTYQVSKFVPFPKTKPAGPECGQAFCRLGCVCSSLQHPTRVLLHCRRPECMFDCTCFKRTITKQTSADESKPQANPVYSITNMEHVVQPHPRSCVNKLWNRNIENEDPEPLYTPKSSSQLVVQAKVPKRIIPPRPTLPIREEDKDPVYKYLESMMTCARVRAFNSKPPPEVTLEPNIPAAAAAPNTAAKPQNNTDKLPKSTPITMVKKAEKTSQETTSGESEARKQIQIQSACHWSKDRTMVLEALCERMNQNRLAQRFYVGPYCISPVTKIFMKKPSGSVVTYRVLISKPSKASDYDEDEVDDSDQSSDGDMDSEAEEDGKIEEPEIQFGVIPFLSGVIPAGRLRARRKPVGRQAQGLIQVNGKSYNQARLLLGKMGSLHPANRLAAYVTGRLHTSGDTSHKNSQKPNSLQRNNPLGGLRIKAAGSVVPPLITARKTTDLKTPAQCPVQSLQQDSWKKGSISLPQPSQNSSIKPVQSFILSHNSSSGCFQNSSTSSPVSLTVSPALKSPSFLGQRGTYSFRICPPSNQGTGGQQPPGVTLPGGFTFIQLPNHGADGAHSLQSEPQSTTNMASTGDAPPQKEGAANFSHIAAELIGLDTREKVRRLLSSKTVGSGSSELICEKKMGKDESNEVNQRKTVKQEESSIDIISEDFSSDSSDCSEYEDADVETVEERPGTDIAKMKAALQESRDSSGDFGSLREFNVQDHVYCESINEKKLSNHSMIARQKRSELRMLFDKLQIILQSDPRAPKLQVLTLAQKEIQHLARTSKCLEERKEMLTKMQAVYVLMLSKLTGKPESLIKDKLKHIYERQKRRDRSMKLKPFFSQLLQSRAAFLQANPPKPQPRPSPLLLPRYKPPSQANPCMSSLDHNIKTMLALLQPIQPKPQAKPSLNTPRAHFTPPAAPSPAKPEVKAPPSQKREPVASAQASQHPIKLESKREATKNTDKVKEPQTKPQAEPKAATVKATPPVPAAQDGASTSKCTNSQVPPPLPVTLPLVCTKNGRIILPSSLKPLGNGFYTLMVMTAKQDGEVGSVSSPANIQPSNVDSSKTQEKTSSTSDQPPDSETSCISEDKTASSDCAPKCSVAPNSSILTAHPLAKISNLSKSIFVPLVDLKNAAKSNSKHVNQVSSLIESEPEPSPPVGQRRRGRPRKTLLNPADDSDTSPVVEEAKESGGENEMQVEEKQSQQIKRKVEEVDDEAAEPVKRARGRPPKNKRAANSPSSEYSPDRRFKSLNAKAKKSPSSTASPGEVNASRPLTRGALGKDFPSAKKRSWIDIEKELDPDIEYE